MRTVRVSNRPDEEIEVSEAEYLDLVRQGLVEAQEDENRKEEPAQEKEAPASPTPAPKVKEKNDGSVGN